MSAANMKFVFNKIMNKNKFIPKKSTSLPGHLKAYPNMKFNRNRIINFYYKVKGKVNFADPKALPVKLEYSKIRLPSKLKEVMPPQHDFINFKNMTGNEILLNMRNYEYFKASELVNGFYEFSKRVNLPENAELSERNWTKHSYFRPVYNKIVKKMPTFNLKHVTVTALAFDNLNLNSDPIIWKKLEEAVDRLLHKLRPSDIILFLELFNKHPNRVNKEFINKLLTIMPIHVEYLKDEELLSLMKVCIKLELVNERLFSYFIYPRLEVRVKKLKFADYHEVLRILCKLHYQEDSEFWTQHILPCIFNFEYSQRQAKSLWEAMLKVKIECPSVDVSRHLMLIENMLKQFENMKESGQDYKSILLKLEEDMTLMPVIKKTFTMREAKEAEKRLKDQATLRAFMEKINLQGDEELRAKEAEMNINKLLEVKDWKKARYELNLAEMEKLKQAAEEAEEVAPEPIKEEQVHLQETTIPAGEKVVDISADNKDKEKEDQFNLLNTKFLEKRAKMKKKENKIKETSQNDTSTEKTN